MDERQNCTPVIRHVFRLVHVQNFGEVASLVPWGWRDGCGKTGNLGRVGDKSMFKMYKKAGLGREGDIS